MYIHKQGLENRCMCPVYQSTLISGLLTRGVPLYIYMCSVRPHHPQCTSTPPQSVAHMPCTCPACLHWCYCCFSELMERVLCLFNPQKDVSKYSVMIAEEDADIDTDLPGIYMYMYTGFHLDIDFKGGQNVGFEE